MHDYQDKLSIPCDWIEHDITVLQLSLIFSHEPLHHLVCISLYVVCI
jgi:hypothetical protein